MSSSSGFAAGSAATTSGSGVSETISSCSGVFSSSSQGEVPVMTKGAISMGELPE